MKRSFVPIGGAAIALLLCASTGSAQGVTQQALDKAPVAPHRAVGVTVLPSEAAALTKSDARPSHVPARRKVTKSAPRTRLAIPSSLSNGKHGLMSGAAPGHAPASLMTAPKMTAPAGLSSTAPVGHAPKPSTTPKP